MLSLTESDISGLKLEDPNPNYTWACSALTLQTKKEGFFKDYAEQVEHSLNASSLAKFGRLIDDESRIKFCINVKTTHCLQAKPFYRAKSAADAAGLRDQAELFLQVGNAKSALQLLSRSIVRAPAPGSSDDKGEKLLARSFAARAKALHQLGLFELAIRDTQCALSAGLPQGIQRCRLLETQGQCYEATGQLLRAKLAFVSAAQLLDTTAENEDWRNELLKASKRCEEQLSTSVTPPINKSKDLPKVTAGEGNCPDLPLASKLLGVAKDHNVGRYVKAVDHIHTGDTLLVEPAYVACLLTEKSGTHCHHCFGRLEAPVGCPVCSGVVFCGPDCQAEACETYHKIECRFNNLFIGSGMSILCYMALRMVTRAGSADNFVALWKAANQENKGKKPKNEVQRNENPEVEKYQRVLKLEAHETQRTTKDYLHRSLMAIFLVKCLQAANFFSTTSAPGAELNSTEILITKALLRHLQILQFNAHEVFETLAKAKNKIKGSRTQYLGVALYSSVALFNHDCYPAVARCFNGTNIIIQALRPLKPDEVVAENYGPIFTKRNKEERQKALRSRYWFACQCQACKEDWPGYDTGLVAQVKSPAAQNIYELAFSTMESSNLNEAIILLSAFIESVHDIVSLPDREICLAMDALRLCLAARWGTVVVPEIKEKPTQEGQEDRVQIAELVE